MQEVRKSTYHTSFLRKLTVDVLQQNTLRNQEEINHVVLDNEFN